MSAAPDFGFAEDDWMAVADAVGVSREHHPDNLLNFRPHPAHRAEFSDVAFEARVAKWSAEKQGEAS